jgi:hypothetical protein
MKRSSFLLIGLLVLCTLVAQDGRVLSIYKNGYLSQRVPVSEIDSMNFNSSQHLLPYNEIADAPQEMLSMLVNNNLYPGVHDSFGFMAILHATDMMTEDIMMNNNQWFWNDYIFNNHHFNSRRTNMIWAYFNGLVVAANKVINSAPDQPEPVEIRKALGHAYGMRGFANFYLMQLYEQTAFYEQNNNIHAPTIPLIFATREPEFNQYNYRVPAEVVMQFCESDYLKAKNLLNGITRTSKNELDVNVVNGLLARLYLLKGDWPNAATAAMAAREGYPLMSALDLDDGFMSIDNPEWIWGFRHDESTTTFYASFFSHISSLSYGYAGIEYNTCYIDEDLYAAIQQEDLRKMWFQNETGTLTHMQADENATGWQEPYACLKFGYEPGLTQDYVYMRAAEMVLIEAEARLRMGNTSVASSLYSQIRAARGASFQPGSVVLEEILLERRIELWGEGFAYFDLKRLNRGVYRGENHDSRAPHTVIAGDPRWVYEFPQSVISTFPALGDDTMLPTITVLSQTALSGTAIKVRYSLQSTNELPYFVSSVRCSEDPAVNLNVRSSVGTDLDGDGVFEVIINELNPSTTYYIKCMYSSKHGSKASEIVSVTTPAIVIPVVQLAVSDIQARSIHAEGSYTFGGSSEVVYNKGFELSKVADFSTLAKTVKSESLNATIEGLSPLTTYYVRAFVQSTDGTGYSQVAQVTTLNAPTQDLTALAGSYTMSDYVYESEDLESSYVVTLELLPDNDQQMKLINFWEVGGEVIVDVDLTAATVTIQTDQAIWVHSTYGSVNAWPIIETVTTEAPLVGVIQSDGSIRFNAWSARCSAGYFGRYAYSLLVPVPPSGGVAPAKVNAMRKLPELKDAAKPLLLMKAER